MKVLFEGPFATLPLFWIFTEKRKWPLTPDARYTFQPKRFRFSLKKTSRYFHVGVKYDFFLFVRSIRE